jgi:hypothetical protein
VALPCAEGYESLSEIRLSAKKRNVLSLLLADTRLRDENEGDNLMDSFITRVQDISGQLPSNRCARKCCCHGVLGASGALDPTLTTVSLDGMQQWLFSSVFR